MAMMSPTVRMLTCLASFGAAAEAVDAAAAGLAPHQVRVLRNEVEYRLMLPGDPGYDGGDGEARVRLGLSPPPAALRVR